MFSIKLQSFFLLSIFIFDFCFISLQNGFAETAANEWISVSNSKELQFAIRQAKPGQIILIEPGKYSGEIWVENLNGEKDRPITIKAADPDNRPVFQGGKYGWHIAKCKNLVVDGLVIESVESNGLNIDDGGNANSPSTDLLIQNVRIENCGLLGGNHDGIKLSGIDRFQISNCELIQWGSGGSGVDMVGCHFGKIERCFFRATPKNMGNGVQAKGGSSEIRILECRFENAGQRGVNLGGSTGTPYFRPATAQFEAKSLWVENCVFIGSHASVAFVGVDGAIVRNNTMYLPERYVVRILQENRNAGIQACRNGVFEKNLVFYDSARVSNSTNIGPGTEPESFVFRENQWVSQTGRGRLRHEIPDQDSVKGSTVKFINPQKLDLRLSSEAEKTICGSKSSWALMSH